MNGSMKARITVDYIAGRGFLLQAGDEVDLSVLGDYAAYLLRVCAIELVEPILAVVEMPQPDSSASLI